MSEFPKMLYQDGGGHTIVETSEAERDLLDSGEGWSATPSPAHFRPSEHHSIRADAPSSAAQNVGQPLTLEIVMDAVRQEFAPLLERRGPGRPRKDEVYGQV